ncbi:MAG: glycoside hydrolase family 43 protein, partial [Bacteroidaceae bacterium]|nr:glycoside hydrolase family 43 protein [Bacteroidaceae bacterium]
MNKIKNPIIPGFYPDPSICRVGEDYYICCSSFELCPGLPVFHSKDLANWEQICYAMTMENGLHVEPNVYCGGVMAPTLRYYKGIFYIINCNFADEGNFMITAKDPAGPWSKPIYLKDVPGIDASIFFDEAEDKVYIMGTADNIPTVEGGLRQGIWACEYDIENFKCLGEPVALWGGAMDKAASPESPHIYHIGDYYYLLIAEGGTEHYHSVTIARSKNALGPYEAYRGNPVMTHRHMGYYYEIGNVGHADLVETPDGDWYAVMLASRTIDGIYKNFGRETFICPVIWERDWPV